MNRRQFSLASLPALLAAGCRSRDEPARDATLVHNREVGAAVKDVDAAMDGLDMRLTAFGPENWRDALANLQTSVIRLRTEVEELKRALGYAEPAGEHEAGEHG